MKLKNIIAELKNSLEVFNNRLDYGEEIISKLKDRPFENIHYCWRSKFFLSEDSLGTYGTPSNGLIYALWKSQKVRRKKERSRKLIWRNNDSKLPKSEEGNGHPDSQAKLKNQPNHVSKTNQWNMGTAREGPKMLEDRQKTMNKLAIAHLSFTSNYLKSK